jgi:transposase-like protein
MSKSVSQTEVITGVARRRPFTTEQKLAVVTETMQPGKSISYVARRHGLSPSLVLRWRQLMSEGGKEPSASTTITNSSPTKASKMSSGGTRESEQPRRVAKGAVVTRAFPTLLAKCL